MSFDDIMSGIRRLRTSIRISTGRPEAMPREKARLLGQNLVAKLQSGNQTQNQLQHLQASRNPTSNQGAQGPMYTNSSRTGLFGFAGFLRPKPQPQAPPPLTAEQKAELEKQKKLKELEDKKKLAREKQYRLDNMRGLSVDRT